ncbi:LysR substrate-binding domain-containing protein [Nioella sp.]|uniref:LysR substrate-binding domain-containing protein n=1 Tax=Nioella sp. TaxID=1912091 RepID=UPI003A84601E
MITLRQMSFLVALAEEMNFTRAAARCHVTQPTLSAGLRELEDRLGVKLVERTSRSLLITEVGEQVVEEARRLLDGARRIETLAKAHLNPEEGDLRLGAIPTIGPYLLPRAIPEIRETFPHLRVFMREEMTESLLEGVESGRLDLALIALPFETGALATEPLFTDGYHLATPESLPLEEARRELDLLLLERGHCLQRHALAAVDTSAFRRNAHFEATSLPTLIAMVGEGLGMTLLPDLAVRTGVAEGQGVRLTPLPDACPRRVALVWRRTTSRAETFRRIGEVLRRSARDGGFARGNGRERAAPACTV